VSTRRAGLVVPADVSPPELCYHHHLAKSVLDQATLCPLPATARPVHWQYDHALHLYPQPHLAVLADRAARYDVEPIEADGCVRACMRAGRVVGGGGAFDSVLPACLPALRGVCAHDARASWIGAALSDARTSRLCRCACLNPGSFFVDFGFSCYTPLTHSIEPCQLP
jgi:hypothetical protein